MLISLIHFFSIGEVSLDWADNDVTRMLSDDAPVLGILHHISGNSRQEAGFMHYAANRGWRSCVLNRRGHSGMPLRAPPYFNILGNADDRVAMVGKMRKKYPNNFIALAGVSAGSAQVVSYIGREGDRVQINAAASLSAGWDFKTTLAQMHACYPLVDRYITKAVKNHFLEKERNQDALRMMPEALIKCRQATFIHELFGASAPFAGCRDLEHCYEENNPLKFFAGNKIPCFMLHALDDFVFTKGNIDYEYIRNKAKNYVLLVTKEGSHASYTEGSLGQGNYMRRVTLDFFDTIRHLQQ